jgi:hypothetical protein
MRATRFLPALLSFGCSTMYTVKAEQLQQLDGYRAPAVATSAEQTTRTLVDEKGEARGFDTDWTLRIVTPDRDYTGTPLRLDVSSGTVTGVIAKEPDQPFSIPLDHVERVSVWRFSGPRTIALVGAVVGTVLLLGTYSILTTGIPIGPNE